MAYLVKKIFSMLSKGPHMTVAPRIAGSAGAGSVVTPLVGNIIAVLGWASIVASQL